MESANFDATVSFRSYNNALQYGRTLLFMANDGRNLSQGRNNIVIGTQSSQGSAITYNNAIQSLGGGYLGFFSSGYSTTSPVMYIDNTGNTHIQGSLNIGGVSTGSNNLIVSGSITATGGLIGNCSGSSSSCTGNATAATNFAGTPGIVVSCIPDGNSNIDYGYYNGTYLNDDNLLPGIVSDCSIWTKKSRFLLHLILESKETLLIWMMIMLIKRF